MKLEHLNVSNNSRIAMVKSLLNDLSKRGRTPFTLLFYCLVFLKQLPILILIRIKLKLDLASFYRC